MTDTELLFTNNRKWSEAMRHKDVDFFTKLSRQQSPRYLWIGCSDSRVPANEIVGLLPGELFVHRNVANVVVHTDLNCLSVMQFAVDVIKVEHIIVCGHYGCGGVLAALRKAKLGLIDNWLRHIQDVVEKHSDLLPEHLSETVSGDLLCELNVLEQMRNASQTTIVQEAWARGQALEIHGWVYGLKDGLLRNLGCNGSSTEEVASRYQHALKSIATSAGLGQLPA